MACISIIFEWKCIISFEDMRSNKKLRPFWEWDENGDLTNGWEAAEEVTTKTRPLGSLFPFTLDKSFLLSELRFFVCEKLEAIIILLGKAQICIQTRILLFGGGMILEMTLLEPQSFICEKGPLHPSKWWSWRPTGALPTLEQVGAYANLVCSPLVIFRTLHLWGSVTSRVVLHKSMTLAYFSWLSG